MNSDKAQLLLEDWKAFQAALRKQFVRWDATTTDTQTLLCGLKQIGSARSYFNKFKHIKMRLPPIPDFVLFLAATSLSNRTSLCNRGFTD